MTASAPNLLDRQFAASRPNQVWLAHLTEIPTGEGWPYLAAIMDLHTRKVVGSSGSHRTRAMGARPCATTCAPS